jgi:exopolysaccharide production protein ExoY
MKHVTMTRGYQNYIHLLPFKRCLDVVLSLICLAILLLPMVVIAVPVWLQSGRIIFAQRRVGRYGNSFNCYKFNGMRQGAAQYLEDYLARNPEAAKEWAWSHKLKRDPRLIPVARFLRRWSLDELPQIFNILRGDMTFVGPRPIVHEEIDRYGAKIEDYYACVPGLTGLWQIAGRSDLSFERQVALNSIYIRRWRVRFELSILLRTIPVVLSGRGAY